jgi:hypothetical protein
MNKDAICLSRKLYGQKHDRLAITPQLLPFKSVLYEMNKVENLLEKFDRFVQPGVRDCSFGIIISHAENEIDTYFFCGYT